MPFIKPLERKNLSSLEETFQGTEGFLGFLPNDVLTMAYIPQATEAFMHFCVSLYQNATLPTPIVHLIGMMASAASGCRYCTAHTANKSFEEGIGKEKIAALWEFETSEYFTESERAALSFALAAGQTPNLVEQAHYNRLRKHFTEKEIVEMLFIICQFGFWNRWNDSVGTQLENTPKSFAEDALPSNAWQLGKHAE